MKKTISILLTVMLASSVFTLPIYAKTWVTVSSWAYNDVSNFKKAGLLPSGLEDVSDYTQNITRLQFAELLYSALTKTANIAPIGSYSRIIFFDTDSDAAKALKVYNIFYGEEDGTYAAANEPDRIKYKFRPDRLLTREEAAAVIYRCVQFWCPYLLSEDTVRQSRPSDFDEISGWAKDNVGKLCSIGMFCGMDDGSFAPKAGLTIEQAISVIYRLYNHLPASSLSDGANIISDGEQLVQTYSNGITETKYGNMLYLKNGKRDLMSFETDIYSNIYSATLNGVIYAAAQNRSGKTDVYNAETQELVFRIPYPIYDFGNKNYIVTKSSNVGPMTFGAYDYSGKELLEPLYSLEEVDEISANGFELSQENPQEASGWIFFTDSNDEGHLYAIDSNGENKRKLSNLHCYDIEYINSRLYYHADGEDGGKGLYCIKADGTHEQCITKNKADIFRFYYEDFKDIDGGASGTFAQRYDERHLLSYDDKWVYYEENNKGITSMYRVSVSDKAVIKENVTDECNVHDIQYRDGRIYFMDITKRINNLSDYDKGRTQTYNLAADLYCYDGAELTRINGGLGVVEYGFSSDRLIMDVGTTYEDTVVYTAELDGSNPQAHPQSSDEDSEISLSRTEEIILEEISDEKFTVYNLYKYSNDNESSLLVRDSHGKETLITDKTGYSDKRIGDVIYYEQDGCIIAYDMNTNEKKTIAENVRYIDSDGDNWFTYTDYGFNTWRYNSQTDTVSEIFPNNNLKRYGKVQKILRSDTGMYKVDTDGNYSFITEAYAVNCIYAENGSCEGVHF